MKRPEKIIIIINRTLSLKRTTTYLCLTFSSWNLNHAWVSSWTIPTRLHTRRKLWGERKGKPKHKLDSNRISVWNVRKMNIEWTRWKYNIYSPRARRLFLSDKHAVEEPNLATYVDFPGLIILFLGSENSWRSESESSSGTSVPFRLDESFILNLRFVIPTFVKFHVFYKE